MISARQVKEVDKPKTRKKNWLGPTDNTIRERIITELTSYNIQTNSDSDINRTRKEIASRIYGMERMNRMNIPLVALVLVLMSSPEDQYDDHINVYMRKILALKDIPPENVIRDGLQIDIIRYDKIISDYINRGEEVEDNGSEDEEEFYEDEGEEVDDGDQFEEE
jgi:hypothetical protein